MKVPGNYSSKGTSAFLFGGLAVLAAFLAVLVLAIIRVQNPQTTLPRPQAAATDCNAACNNLDQANECTGWCSLRQGQSGCPQLQGVSCPTICANVSQCLQTCQQIVTAGTCGATGGTGGTGGTTGSGCGSTASSCVQNCYAHGAGGWPAGNCSGCQAFCANGTTNGGTASGSCFDTCFGKTGNGSLCTTACNNTPSCVNNCSASANYQNCVFGCVNGSAPGSCVTDGDCSGGQVCAH